MDICVSTSKTRQCIIDNVLNVMNENCVDGVWVILHPENLSEIEWIKNTLLDQRCMEEIYLTIKADTFINSRYFQVGVVEIVKRFSRNGFLPPNPEQRKYLTLKYREMADRSTNISLILIDVVFSAFIINKGYFVNK